jgi:hypothetical protein
MARIVAIHQVLVALAILYLIAEIVRRRVSAPALWVLLATVGAITAGKLGSGWNHFLEFPLALCLCAGLGWDVLRRLPMRILATGAAATATVFLLLFLKDQTPTQNVWKPVEGCAAAYQFVREQSSDRILSENVGALVLGGKTVWISNPFVYSQLAMHGGSDAPLREMLGNGSFDFIITAWSYLDSPYLQAHGSERFSPEAIQLMAANYRLTKVFQCPDARYVYQPMAAAAQATR